MKCKLTLLLSITVWLFVGGCSERPDASAQQERGSTNAVKPKITFVELGSVKCIPCRMMQPVMASIEKKYGEQVHVIFYDIGVPDQRKRAEAYNIRLIPTQVFLDGQGKEVLRHEGFFPEAEIDSFLQSQGLRIVEGD